MTDNQIFLTVVGSILGIYYIAYGMFSYKEEWSMKQKFLYWTIFPFSFILLIILLSIYFIYDYAWNDLAIRFWNSLADKKCVFEIVLDKDTRYSKRKRATICIDEKILTDINNFDKDTHEDVIFKHILNSIKQGGSEKHTVYIFISEKTLKDITCTVSDHYSHNYRMSQYFLNKYYTEEKHER
jgi:hypothetical protein